MIPQKQEHPMAHDAVRYLLFPHMTLSEGSFRTLSLLMPQLTLLHLLREPDLPWWSRDRIVRLTPPLPEAHREQLRHSLKGFQEFASLHEEHVLMASLSRESLLQENEESRFSIQSTLRGGDSRSTETGERLTLEAALFLEMALDLDEKEKDLESDLAHAEGLESEFRSILGITSEEDLEEDLEPLSSPLLPDRGHLAFMLGQRMASWLRLYPGCQDAGSRSVFVSVLSDVLDTLVDRLLAQRERAGRALPVEALALGGLPDLSRASVEMWKSIHTHIQNEGLLTELWSRLHELVLDPGDGARVAACREEIEVVAGLLRGHMGDAHGSIGELLQITLTHLPDVTGSELWQCLDPSGHAALSGISPPLDASCFFLGVY